MVGVLLALEPLCLENDNDLQEYVHEVLENIDLDPFSLSLSLSVSLSASLSVYLSLHLPISPSLHLSVSVSVSMSLCMCAVIYCSTIRLNWSSNESMLHVFIFKSMTYFCETEFYNDHQ